MDKQIANRSTEKPRYVPPTVTVMNDDEVLKVFQVTSAGVTWWGSQ